MVKQTLCEKFEALIAVLEEKRSELLERISKEQEEKVGLMQNLIQQYKEQLEKSTKLVETAIQSMEEEAGAAFLMVSQLHRQQGEATGGTPSALGFFTSGWGQMAFQLL